MSSTLHCPVSSVQIICAMLGCCLVAHTIFGGLLIWKQLLGHAGAWPVWYIMIVQYIYPGEALTKVVIDEGADVNDDDGGGALPGHAMQCQCRNDWMGENHPAFSPSSSYFELYILDAFVVKEEKIGAPGASKASDSFRNIWKIFFRCASISCIGYYGDSLFFCEILSSGHEVNRTIGQKDNRITGLQPYNITTLQFSNFTTIKH